MKHSPRFLALAEQARSKVRELSVEQTQTALKAPAEQARFIDIREDHEWEQGRCRGAEHLGRGILERDIEKLIPDPAAKIILYCGGGYRSALAAESLQKMGYTNVFSMAGGYKAWVAAGAPILK